ncbi:putative peptide/nitrate transporter [Hibiscus syriacus]|uniref:Peptide/nitrate transporter n=1 Tax=Hibiscus syriacus TaxID=106335 RepID=A0A6A3CLG3_HIBSY|nr:aquaporin SIP1-1-like [Hibiscus syriacus]KAE8730275.1 putative peptide/nitrate transporter [Hibiscus syriacus]
MGVIKSAMADALLTSMWIFSMPFLRVFTLQISGFLGVQTLPLAIFFITTIVVSLMMFIFTLIGSALGGANFNPTASVAFYAAGLKKDMSLLSMAVRFPAQAAGGVVAVKAILGILPRELRKTMKGPSLTTVGCVGTGAKYTGPSLNPANAFGWAYVNKWHNSWQLYYVYWLGPLTGATLAAWVFRFLLSPPPTSTKEKKT